MIFLKKNSYQVVRLLLNQVGIIIFSLIVTMTAAGMDEAQQPAMTLLASLFAVVFYLFLIFFAMREVGNRDSVRIEGGRLTYDPLYGLKVGLLAAVPNFFLAFLMLVGLLLGEAGEPLAAVAYILNYFIQSMYLGIIKALFTALSLLENSTAACIAYFITPLFAPLAALGGYIHGVRHPKRER